MHYLIAFDKFKDALSAQTACAAVQSVIRERLPDARTTIAPLSDGGEGFCEILTQACGGDITTHEVSGPLGEKTHALLGRVRIQAIAPGARKALGIGDTGNLAIIEMAQASGLQQLAPGQRNPLKTTTRGTGELIDIALHDGADAILLGIGGSATSDLGIGALQALGLQAYTIDKERVPHVVPEIWAAIADFGPLNRDMPPIRIACDVANPLLGPNGAAAVYGPQKGLPRQDVQAFDAEAGRIARLLLNAQGEPPALMDVPGAGAAGGIGFGLKATFGAEFVSGFDLVWQWLGLAEKLDAADVVITGEGRFDKSSLQGKGPGALVKAARDKGRQAWVFAGAVDDALKSADVIAISPPDLPLEECLARTEAFLKDALSNKLGTP